MSTIEKGRVKNAPLDLPEDSSDFVAWATSVPDGSISAGWQSIHPHLEVQRDDAWVLKMSALEEGNPLDVGSPRGGAKMIGTEASRRSLAKFVELSRRRLGQSLEQLSEKAEVSLEEALAIETGKGLIRPQTLQRLATFLGVNPQRLLQLAGLAPAENCELEQAALHFAARTESVKPLEPEEQAALERFCEEALALESSRG